MNVKINGRFMEIEKGSSLLDLVLSMGLKPERVVAEVNLEIRERTSWTDYIIQIDDVIELIGFMGGG